MTTPPQALVDEALDEADWRARQGTVEDQAAANLIHRLADALFQAAEALEPFAHRGENPNAVVYDRDFRRAAEVYAKLKGGT